MRYVGMNINGLVAKKEIDKELNGRRRKYIVFECPICHNQKEIRADKRKNITKCDCLNENKSKVAVKQKRNDILIKCEWEKIKNSNICSSKEEMEQKYFNNRIGKFYKKNNNRPFSSDNYIFGSYEDVKKYYKERNKIHKKNKEEEIKKIEENVFVLSFCPFCKKRKGIFANICPHCKRSLIPIYDGNNKRMIENENGNYTQAHEHFLVNSDKKREWISIKDIPSNYLNIDNSIKRIGIIRVDKIDYKNQGIIGLYQGISSNGQLFTVENVFQHFGCSSYLFINGTPQKVKEIHTFSNNNTYKYAFVIKDKSEYYQLAICDGILIKTIAHIKKILANGYNKIYYKGIDNCDYIVDINTNIIDKWECTKIISNENVSSYARNIIEAEEKHIIYFNKRQFKNSLILYEIMNQNCNTSIIENEFQDDCTQNYKAVVDKDEYELMDMYYMQINKKSDPLTYFGNSYAIYGYPIFRIFRDLIIENKKHILEFVDKKIKDNVSFIIDKMNNSTTNIDKYNIIIKKLKQKYNCNELELLFLMINKYGLRELLGLYYLSAEKRLKFANKYTLKENMDYIYNNIYKENQIPWKSEYELYLMIKYYYPDAIYQYTDERFMGFIFDIFVPSINTVFEYQGIYHYEKNAYFNETLKERKENDLLKKKLCNKNGVSIIEWKYNELINKLVLDEKMEKTGN